MRLIIAMLCTLHMWSPSFSFIDNHDDGTLSGWSIVGTRMWAESNGALTPVNSNNTGFILCDSVTDMQLGDLTVQLKTDQWSGGSGGVVFCYNNASQYYYVTVEPKSTGTGTVTLYKNNTSGTGTIINSSLTISSAENSTLTISLTTDSLLFALNGVSIGGVLENSFRGGSFGYYHNTSWSGYISIYQSKWEEIAASNGSLEIVQQPQDLHLFAGGSGTLEVIASIADSISYQWYADTGLISGATESSLLLPLVTVSDSGKNYFCQITTPNNVITSDTAVIHVSTATRKMITLKGHLQDFNANSLGTDEATEVDLLIRLYSAKNAGRLLYEEAFFKNAGNAIVVDSGGFHVRLGAADTLDLTSVFQENQSVFAEFHLAVPGNSFEKLSPRIAITSTPYALSANTTVLKGVTDPNTIGLDAPVGTLYVNKENKNTYIKAVKSWVLITE